MVMMRGCVQLDQFYSGCFGTFAIFGGHSPVALCGKGLIVALYGVCGLRPFVARGSLASCMTYAANCPCGKELIVVPSPVAILGKRFVVALFGKGFIVTLLDECGLLGILAVLALGAVHAVFIILAVLALGNIHIFSNVLAVLNLSVFALLVVAWRDKVVIASCN
jgi:hypothetical protein